MKSLKLSSTVCAIGMCVAAGSVTAQTKYEQRAARAAEQNNAQRAVDALKLANFEALLPARIALVNSVANQYAAELTSDGMDGVKRLSHFAMTLHATPSEVLNSSRSAASVSDFVQLQGSALARLDVSKAALGDVENLVFLAVGPCRFADSRFSTGGVLVTNVIRAYRNYSVTGQGGDAGCNNTSGVAGVLSGSPGAIAMNIAVAVPSQAGNLIARPVGSTSVTAASNFAAGDIISNATVIKMTGTGGADFELLPLLNGPTATTHVILDLLGFYVPSQPAALQCVDTASVQGTTGTSPTLEASASAPACGAGFTRVSMSCVEDNDAVLTDFDVSAGTCSFIPRAATATTFNVSARCCRIPGTNVGRF